MALRFPPARSKGATGPPVDRSDASARPAHDWAAALSSADHACCCAAPPLVAAVLAMPGGDDEAVDLLLCGHHYRAFRAALLAADAVVFDAEGAVVTQQWPG